MLLHFLRIDSGFGSAAPAPNPEKSNQTELGYRLAWARTYLKKYGLLENSRRGIWALTARAKGVEKLNPQDVVRAVRGLEKKEEKGKGTETAAPHEVS
jgi:restriction system protein